MPGAQKYQIEFEGEVPVILWVFIVMAFVIWISGFLSDFIVFHVRNAPHVWIWYYEHWWLFELACLFLMAIVLIVHRKRVRLVRPWQRD